MPNQLPTQAEMFDNAADCLRDARIKLSDARDWLNSDWQGLDTTPLPTIAGEARQLSREAIIAARATLDTALDALADVGLHYRYAARAEGQEDAERG